MYIYYTALVLHGERNVHLRLYLAENYTIITCNLFLIVIRSISIITTVVQLTAKEYTFTESQHLVQLNKTMCIVYVF